MNQQIICIEVTRVDDNFSSGQTNPLVIHQDTNNNYYLSLEQLDKIRAKIIKVVRLGSNYRHPLLFDVQVIPGNADDALINSAGSSNNNRRRRRRNKE